MVKEITHFSEKPLGSSLKQAVKSAATKRSKVLKKAASRVVLVRNQLTESFLIDLLAALQDPELLLEEKENALFQLSATAAATEYRALIVKSEVIAV